MVRSAIKILYLGNPSIKNFVKTYQMLALRISSSSRLTCTSRRARTLPRAFNNFNMSSLLA